MHYEIHPDLDKILTKLAKKDRVQFEAVMNKIDEISDSDNINKYKNLRSPMNEYKRVHIHSSFVLLFKVQDNTIIFRYYDHHNQVYKNSN